MDSRRERFEALRRELAGRGAPRAGAQAWRTGLAGVDAQSGGLCPGLLHEWVFPGASRGSQLALLALLERAREERRYAALVDGNDAFDPVTAGMDLGHVLWVRCASLEQVLGAADVLLRDENFGVVAVDVRDTPVRVLRRLPSHPWYRLQRLAEQAGGVLVFLTPEGLIPSARRRWSFEYAFGLESLDRPRMALPDAVVARLVRGAAGPGAWSGRAAG